MYPWMGTTGNLYSGLKGVHLGVKDIHLGVKDIYLQERGIYLGGELPAKLGVRGPGREGNDEGGQRWCQKRTHEMSVCCVGLSCVLLGDTTPGLNNVIRHDVIPENIRQLPCREGFSYMSH